MPGKPVRSKCRIWLFLVKTLAKTFFLSETTADKVPWYKKDIGIQLNKTLVDYVFCWLVVVGVLPGMVHVRNLLPLVCQEAVPLARLNEESQVKSQPIGSHLASFPPIGFKDKTIQPIRSHLASVPSIGFNNNTIQPMGFNLTSFRPIGFNSTTKLSNQ
jgi:hypothetical protein